MESIYNVFVFIFSLNNKHDLRNYIVFFIENNDSLEGLYLIISIIIFYVDVKTTLLFSLIDDKIFNCFIIG